MNRGRKALQAWTITFGKQMLVYTYAHGVFAQAAKRRAFRTMIVMCLERPRHLFRVVAERRSWSLLRASIGAWAKLTALSQWHCTRARIRGMLCWRAWLSRRRQFKRFARRAHVVFANRRGREALNVWRRQTASLKLLRRVFDGAFARREVLASLPRRHSEAR
jgi:hypothetical protein